MRRVVCRQFGDPEGLVFEDAPDPDVGPGTVLVDVRAAAVNFVDALLVQGRYQIKPPLPFTPGMEVAGVVAAIGDGVTAVAVGDPVLATTMLGGYADRALVPEPHVLSIPGGLTFGQAAAFLQSYATMFYAYTRRTSITAGENVLVLGAGGGIGLAAVDLAKAMGATVVAAASSGAKLDAALAVGADATIDYESEDLKVRARELAGGSVDIVVDPVGGDYAEPALRALGWGGRYLVVGFASGTIPAAPLNHVLLNSRTVIGIDWGAWIGRDPRGNRAMLDELFALAGTGTLHPTEPTAAPLSASGRVLRDLLDRRVVGRVVLGPDPATS
jgi:NADPH2:quinone reductase